MVRSHLSRGCQTPEFSRWRRAGRPSGERRFRNGVSDGWKRQEMFPNREACTVRFLPMPDVTVVLHEGAVGSSAFLFLWGGSLSLVAKLVSGRTQQGIHR